jgi:L-alanine-DL-glutamate epimerase-like enolase superfamily enzyme
MDKFNKEKQQGLRNQYGAGGMSWPRNTIRIVGALIPDTPLIIDPNKSCNYNIARDLVRAAEDSQLLWVEEGFHEDPELYHHLRDTGFAHWLQLSKQLDA